MNNNFFPSALNTATRVLDGKVLRWAWDAGLFESPAELERCRVQKINWFASYLFPEEEAERLEQIMKFFLGLFLLDDLLDIGIDNTMIKFLEGLKVGDSIHPNSRLQSLGIEIYLLQKSIEEENKNSFAREEWHKAWLEYIDALQWEIQIKIDGRAPLLGEYRVMRPKTSGVHLAMLLIRPEKDIRGCISELLEFSLARYICLSNDLASSKKELAIGDPHNEIIILMESMGDAAVSWVMQEVKQLSKKIVLLAKQVGDDFGTCQEWVGRLLLLAGGCEAWTAETSRYQNSINGNFGKH
ncbi:terpene synthase family protein [Algoriphagus yeomjeoni]|uniref:terpene synthase family protein n=1 Tax=Algoriphagus yeomjeoni TaxID=291403 RepID=UPI003CE5C639